MFLHVCIRCLISLYLTQLNSSYFLVSLLIPDLEGKVGWMVAALINLEGDVLAWVAAGHPEMPLNLRNMFIFFIEFED